MHRWNNHFNARLKEFIQFKENFGRWPSEESVDFTERSLGVWARKARLSYNKGTLIKSRENALKKIGFPLNLRENNWNQRVKALKAFVLKYKRLPSPNDELYYFSYSNHSKFHKLTDRQKAILKSFGFTELWEEKDHAVVWEKRLNDLVTFYKKHGKFPTRKEDSTLEPWLVEQRRLFKEGKLSSQRKDMFKKAGINILAGSRIRRFKNGKAWEGNYELVATFIKKNGRLPKYSRKPSKEIHLYRWIMNQNLPIKKGQLSKEQIEKLKRLLSSFSNDEEGGAPLIKKALQAYNP
jgi:hypothetical protein